MSDTDKTIEAVGSIDQTESAEPIYMVDATTEYHSWFSNSSWTEGYIAFIRGKDGAFAKCNEIDTRMLDETRDHREQIRGECKSRLIIGIVQNAKFDRNRHNRIGKIELYIMTNIPPRTKTEIHYEITHVPKL